MQEGLGAARLLLAALCLALPGCGDPSRLFLHPAADMIGTPADIGARFEEVRMPRTDGGVTRGWWIPNARSDAAIVIFGGNSGNRSHALPYAAIVWSEGFSVMLLDYRGFGPDNGEASVRDLPWDAVAAVEWVSKRSRRTGVWGMSLGSAVALGVAGRRPELVDAVCVEASFLLGPAARSYMGRAVSPLLAAPLAAITRALLLDRDSDPEASVARRRADVPVFFIHGDRDRLLLTAWGAELFENAPGPREMWIEEDTGHCPESLYSAAPEYSEQVTRFFRRTLLGERQPQAGATWTARRTPDGWEADVDVICEGPFPAPVEVVAVHETGVERMRIMARGRQTSVVLFTPTRPLSASARRYARVTLRGSTWEPDLSPLTRDYRELRRLKGLPAGDSRTEALLAAELDPLLSSDLAALLLRAAKAAAGKPACDRLALKALETALPFKEAPWIVGDAYFARPWKECRAGIYEDARSMYVARGWDPRVLDEKMRELEPWWRPSR